MKMRHVMYRLLKGAVLLCFLLFVGKQSLQAQKGADLAAELSSSAGPFTLGTIDGPDGDTAPGNDIPTGDYWEGVGDITITDKNITLAATGTIIINGDLILDGSTNFTNGGRLIVIGDLIVTGTANLASSNMLVVFGDVDIQHTGSVSGASVVGGDVKGTTPSGYNYSKGKGNLDDYETDAVAADLRTVVDQVNNRYITFGALPVELLYFNANRKNSNIELEWETTYEENNDFFVIQRSIDAKEYVSLDTIHGLKKGVYDYGQVYQFVDRDAPMGIVYYRLKQMDIDRKFEYYNVIVNPAAQQRGVNMEIYGSDPFVDTPFRIQFYSPITQQIYLMIVNSKGMMTYEKRITISGGYTSLLIPELSIEKGLSLLSLITAHKKQVVKIVR
ncbi:hypothetical protein [Algivirga pacifica]|uniref:Uncharacterized protein n=1 Tax=Algivirga pacifica TaxID=1162670 RepID=A0ABP9DDW9_9BACT